MERYEYSFEDMIDGSCVVHFLCGMLEGSHEG